MECPPRQVHQLHQRLNVAFVLRQGILELVNPAIADLLPALVIGFSENDTVAILGLNDKHSELRNDDVVDLCGSPFAIGNDHVIDPAVTAWIETLRKSPPAPR